MGHCQLRVPDGATSITVAAVCPPADAPHRAARLRLGGSGAFVEAVETTAREDVTGKVAILADDGLATGSGMRAAILALRRLQPSRIVVAVPRPAVSLQGLQKTYTRMGDSGQQVINRFCPDCGSTVVIEPAALSRITIIPAGTLDETAWLKPTMEIYCDDAQSWVRLGGGMQRFPKMHHAKR